jgi:hypothetical protein
LPNNVFIPAVRPDTEEDPNAADSKPVRYLSSRSAGKYVPTGFGADTTAPPLVPIGENFDPGQAAIGDRFGGWTAAYPAGASRSSSGPEMPLLGRVSGKPMSFYPVQPPIFGFAEKAASGDEDWLLKLLAPRCGRQQRRRAVRPIGLPENNFETIEIVLDPSGKSGYNAIIARTLESPSAAGFLFAAFHRSDGGRTSRRHISPYPASVASEPPSEPSTPPCWPVRANALAPRRGSSLRRTRPLRLRDTACIDRTILGRGRTASTGASS